MNTYRFYKLSKNHRHFNRTYFNGRNNRSLHDSSNNDWTISSHEMSMGQNAESVDTRTTPISRSHRKCLNDKFAWVEFTNQNSRKNNVNHNERYIIVLTENTENRDFGITEQMYHSI